jgi:predicted nucleotidyltransferase
MYDYSQEILPLSQIKDVVRKVAEKYLAAEVFLFGSYARGEAKEDSDLDFLVYGGEKFRPTDIFAMAEECRLILKKRVDMFEIREVDVGTPLHEAIMREKVRLV